VVTWNARLRSSAGRCRRGRRQIELNPKIVLHYTREEVVDVMLHEIAHVLTVGGHTKVWCMMFKAIGGSGRRHARRAGV
jgi:predicted SprT family Zn-dependent metalloprotease